MTTIVRSAWCLLGGTLMTSFLYAARVATARTWVFGFLLFNLMLALIPWALAVLVQRTRRRDARFALSALWLLFLPNAPYLVTDFIHLRARAPIPLYYDAVFLSFAALTGLLSGAFSLSLVADAWAETARERGRLLRSLLVPTAVIASGFGIYLGRFERWNSWDLFLHPLEVLASVGRFPTLRVLTVTGACAALLGLAYLAVGGNGERARRLS